MRPDGRLDLSRRKRYSCVSMSTTIRDEEYVPMIVVDPKVKTLLICPVCGAAVSRSARSTHTAWHAQLETRA
jgi:hypothetical protein